MKIGKFIVFGLIALIIILMGYLATSSTNVAQKAPKEEANKPKQEQTKSTKIESDSDLEKIKELEKSVSKSKTEVSKLFLTRCAPCHNSDASGIIAPPITGKTEQEILARLKDYKEDKVPNSLMKGLLKNTPDEILVELAKEIANFKAEK